MEDPAHEPTQQHQAKGRRRTQRAAARSFSERNDDDRVRIQPVNEIIELARRGEQLSCGRDVHELLHEMLAAEAERD